MPGSQAQWKEKMRSSIVPELFPRRQAAGGLWPLGPYKSNFTAVGCVVESLTRRGTNTRVGHSSGASDRLIVL
jgi:hypothetical protein